MTITILVHTNITIFVYLCYSCDVDLELEQLELNSY